MAYDRRGCCAGATATAKAPPPLAIGESLQSGWKAAAAARVGGAPESSRASCCPRMAREAYRTGRRPGHRSARPATAQDGEFLAGFIAQRRLDDPATAERHFIAIRQDSRSVNSRARSFYWQGRAAAHGNAAAAREATPPPPPSLACLRPARALALGEDAAPPSARIAAAPAPPITAASNRRFRGAESPSPTLTLADLGDTRRARIFLLRLEELSKDGTERRLAARLANHIGRQTMRWVARRAGRMATCSTQGWPAPYAPPSPAPRPASSSPSPAESISTPKRSAAPMRGG